MDYQFLDCRSRPELQKRQSISLPIFAARESLLISAADLKLDTVLARLKSRTDVAKSEFFRICSVFGYLKVKIRDNENKGGASSYQVLINARR